MVAVCARVPDLIVENVIGLSSGHPHAPLTELLRLLRARCLLLLLLLFDRGARVHVFQEDVVEHDDCIVGTVALLKGASGDRWQSTLVLVEVNDRET